MRSGSYGESVITSDSYGEGAMTSGSYGEGVRAIPFELWRGCHDVR